MDLADYLGGIVTAQEALASTLEGRGIVFDAGSAPWPTVDAPAVGLILLELVTNALKYGAGTVTVTLRAMGREIVLRVADEGRGLPAGFEPGASKGLGMRVLLGLLKGQRGRLEIDRAGGHTCFVVTLRAAGAA